MPQASEPGRALARRAAALLLSAAVEIAVTANAGAEAAELMVCSRAMDDDPLMGAGCLPGTNDMHGPAAGG